MTTALSIIEPPSLPLSAAPAIIDQLLLEDGSTFGKFNLSHIRVSSTNRKRFNAEKLQQLADSVRDKGVAQPILIRPVAPTADAPQRWEIVAGERRFRASIMAGLSHIPAIARELSDHDAIELQILENLQREDPHPLEEAEGYERLMLKHGYSADQLAERLAKSRSYIYGRLKLCALALDVREPFLNDEISASIALLIARIPVPALQSKALTEITRPSWGEPLSYRAAAAMVQQRYMLTLASAVFELTDAKLLAAAGSCTGCSKRTGNQPVLYPDLDANICTDPDCFAEKRAAHDAKVIVQANKKGVPVLEGAAATETLGDLASVFSDGGMWKLDRVSPDIVSHTEIASVLTDKQLPTPKAIVKLDNGKVRKLYDKAAVQAAAEAAGICLTRDAWDVLQAAKEATPQAKARKEDQQKEAAERAARQQRAAELTGQRVALYRQVRQRAAGSLSLASLRELAKALLLERSLPDDLLGDDYPLQDSGDASVAAYIDQAAQSDVQMLILDLLLGEALGVNEWDLRNGELDEDDDEFAVVRAIARHEGIDTSGAAQAEQASLTVEDLTGIDLATFAAANPDRIGEATTLIMDQVPHLVRAWERACNSAGYMWNRGAWHKAECAEIPAATAPDATELPARKTLSIKPRSVTAPGTEGTADDPLIKTKKPARTVIVPTLAYTAPEALDTPTE